MTSSTSKVLIVDNYDSFTFIIAHLVRNIKGINLQIIEASEIVIEDIDSIDRIIFSPGPDFPRPGNSMELILNGFAGKKPILGICLGLQAIFIYFGGRLIQLDEVVHGRKKLIHTTGILQIYLRVFPLSFMRGYTIRG